MAAQGLRDMGDGVEKIASPSEAAELRARGRTVTMLTLASTALATLAVVAVLAL